MLDPTVWSHIQDDIAKLRKTLDRYNDHFSSLRGVDSAIGFIEHLLIEAAAEKEEQDKKAAKSRSLRLVK